MLVSIGEENWQISVLSMLMTEISSGIIMPFSLKAFMTPIAVTSFAQKTAVIWIDDIQVTTDQSVYTIGVPDNFDSYTTPDSFKAEWSIQTNKLDDPNFYTMSFPQGYNGQGKSITTWFNLGSTAWLNYYKPITIPSMANYISFWTYYNGSTDFNVDYTDPQNEKGGAGIWLSNSTTKYKYNFDLKANEGWVQRIIPLTADALGEGFDPNTITTIWLHFGKASTNITLSFDNLEFTLFYQTTAILSSFYRIFNLRSLLYLILLMLPH